MNTRLISIVLLITLSYFKALAFKKCAEVPFCLNLRTHVPDSETKYSLNVDSLQLNGDATIDLVNKKNQSVTLQISALTNDRFRLQFNENNNERYKLSDVLAEEPKTLKIEYQEITDKNVILAVSKEASAKVEITKDPLQVKLFKDNVLQTIVQGDRLYFENTEESQAFTVSIDFPNALKSYGIHEKADHLTLRNTGVDSYDPYKLKNLDTASYKLYDTGSTYGAIPVVYGHGKNGTSGIFLHNAAQQWVEVNSDEGVKTFFIVEGGSLDLFTLPGPSFKEVVRQYTNLTGLPHLPQLWALGYHQSRHDYETQEDVKFVVASMDNTDFPMDTIWLDIAYTDQMKYFTWNPVNFSDPEEMQKNLSSTNRKLVTIIDPHYKVDDSYSVYKGGKDQGLFIKNPDGTDFQGDCWPGLSSYFDFLDPKARDYYASQYSYDNFPHSTETLAGIWNDMNEPSVFNRGDVENTVPPDCLHLGGVKHRDVHNIYGLLQTKATHQGLISRDDNKKRPFILTRSNFAGSQRYAAFWTGDNVATWNYLTVSYSMCLNANILGLAFCGADVAGFISNPDDELYQRWYQAGAWLPFYRAHSAKTTKRREPYLYPEDIQKVVRDALKLRYKHLPVWYTTFFEHVQSGDPIIRPLVYEWPNNEALFEIDDHLLVGQNILVRPVFKSQAKSVDVVFPGDEETFWYNINNDDFFESGDKSVEVPVDISSIPVFYKSGSVVTLKETERPSTVEMENDPYTLVVNWDNDEFANGTLYYDDTVSFEYQLNNDFTYLLIECQGYNMTITQIGGEPSSIKSPLKIESIVINSKLNTTKYSQKKFTKDKNGLNISDFTIDLTREFTINL